MKSVTWHRIYRPGRDALPRRAFDMPPRRGETIEEYRKRMRERYATDPEYRERRRGPLRERRRERYAVDPEYREQVLERQRERYASNPEFRERKRERQRHRMRYTSDVERRTDALSRSNDNGPNTP